MRSSPFRCSTSLLLMLAYTLTASFLVNHPVLAATERTNSKANQSQAKLEDKKFSGSWKAAIGGESYEEGVDKAEAASFNLNASGKYQLTDWLSLIADGKARFYSSQIQARFRDTFGGSNLFLNKFVVQAKPWRYLTLQAGAINQGELDLPLLISNRAFPGLREQLSYRHDFFEGFLMAQQTMPTSSSFNSNRSEVEETPTFFSETLGARFTLTPGLKLTTKATHFAFNNLPAVTAFDSGKIGNTTSGFLAPNSQFLYEFNGYALSGSIDYEHNELFSAGVGGMFVENSKAATASSRGQLLHAEMAARFYNVIFKPRFEMFFNESDTAPAAYNSGRYGHNNREGQSLSLETVFPEWGFKISARATNAKTINPNAFQNDLTAYEISLETIRARF